MNRYIRFLKVCIREYRLGYPAAATIEFTTRCNSQCSICARNVNGVDSAELSHKTFWLIVRKLRQCRKLRTVVIGGWGEPTLHKFFGFFAYQLKHCLPKVELWLITNGIALDLDALMPFDKITVSLNSADRKSYFDTNCVDQFDTVVANINRLLIANKTAEIIVQLLDNKYNRSRLSELQARFTESNYTIDFHPLHNAGGLVNVDLYNSKVFYPCTATMHQVYISTSADAYGCCHTYLYGQHSDLYLGNFADLNMNKLARNPQLKRLRESQADGRRSTLNPCCNCTEWTKTAPYSWVLRRWRLST